MSAPTPLMDQYSRIKSEHKDKILFFRMGDFFEMFNEDAEIAAPILNIALTYRNKKAGLKTKMCGVPHHSVSGPISKLLSAGLSVAICDQIEPASAGKGLVKRAVTRLISPGMVYSLESLDHFTANYMAAFDKGHISFLDLSTGSAFYYELSGPSVFFDLVERLQPKELVLTGAQREKCASLPLFQSLALSLFDKAPPKTRPPWLPLSKLREYDRLPQSAKRLLHYVYLTQGPENLKILSFFEKRGLKGEMYCSSRLYSHLEIFKDYEGSPKGSLFSAINRTKTPNGARLLKQRLQGPLADQKKIEMRLDQIERWVSKPELLDFVRKILAQIGDGERKLGKIAQPTGSARDLLALSLWLDGALKIANKLKGAFSFGEKGDQARLSQELQSAGLLRDKIERIISPDCPAILKEGGLINRGVNPQLDEWMDAGKKGQALVLEMERGERAKLNIPSLKIRYNSVFGYYIEIRKTHSSKVSGHYRRVQTLVSAERYTNKELKALEEQILSARAKRAEMEYQIFKDLRCEALEELPSLRSFCDRLSQTDLYSSLAFLAIESKYVRPRFTADRFKLIAGRHPVLEQKGFHEFVPNTIDLPAHQTLILTGPNMSGKSALMRQSALAVLLAQSGCFVPAKRAELPLFNKMFTRIGASDLLSQGLSTFMVEMKETAEILEKADDRSFIILDELGRGTATFDGLSLAQAVLEFLTFKKRPLLFSATHYRELTQLAKKDSRFINGSMAIREEKGEIHFLYLFKPGPAEKSYGIQVARLAGFPPSALKRAESVLSRHESAQFEKSALSAQKSAESPKLLKSAADFNPKDIEANYLQKKTQQDIVKALIEDISNCPLLTQSPIDALNQIKKWQDLIKPLVQKNKKKPVKTKTSGFFDQTAFPDILN